MIGKAASNFVKGFKVWSTPSSSSRSTQLKSIGLMSGGLLGTTAIYNLANRNDRFQTFQQNTRQRVAERRNRTLGEL